MSGANEQLENLARADYKYGFVTDIEADQAPPGLNEDVVRLISAKKKEPAPAPSGGEEGKREEKKKWQHALGTTERTVTACQDFGRT